MSYPLEKDKGKSFGIFWAIFQFGSFIGSIIALAINIKSGKLSSVTTSTYIVRCSDYYVILLVLTCVFRLSWLSFSVVSLRLSLCCLQIELFVPMARLSNLKQLLPFAPNFLACGKE